MKLNRKWILIMSLVLSIALATTGTLAYLTDSDADVNVMTLGKVSIEQHEYERVVNAEGTYKIGTVDGQDSYILKEFTQLKPLLPIVGDPSTGEAGWDPQGVRMSQVGSHGSMSVFAGKVAQDKFVTVENTGRSDAYVRTYVALEAGSLTAGQHDKVIGTSYHKTWTKNEIGICKINNNNYFVIEYTYAGAKLDDGTYRHKDGILPAGDTSYPNLSQVYMNSIATNDDVEALDGNKNGLFDILVLTQAVQASGFDAVKDAQGNITKPAAQVALEAGFGEATAANVQMWFGDLKAPAVVSTYAELKAALNDGASVELNDNITDIPVNNTAPYGNYYGILLKAGQTIDGNKHVLDFEIGELKDGKADNYGIMASGGTLKNATVTGVFRGVMIMNPTETVTIDNCVIGGEGVCYAINTGEGSNNPQDLIVSNTTIRGWNSYGDALKSIRFTNCKFEQGEYYTNVYGRLVRPYVNAVFDSCDFIGKYYIDLSALGVGQKIVLRNCTVNGVKLTADSWKTLIAPEGTCGDGQISIEGRDNSYMHENNVFDYVVIE